MSEQRLDFVTVHTVPDPTGAVGSLLIHFFSASLGADIFLYSQ